MIATQEATLDPSDYKNPVNFVTNSDSVFKVSIYQTISVSSKLLVNEIYDEKYDFIGEQLKERFLEASTPVIIFSKRDENKVHCTLTEIESNLCSKFMDFEFKASGKTKIIKRKYEMGLDLLGNVGGIFEIIFFFFGLFYCWYKDYARGKYLRHISHKKSHKEYKEILGDEKIGQKMEELIERQMDASRLTSSITSVDMFESSLMKPCHRVLSPLVAMVKQIEREKLKKKRKENPAEAFAQSILAVEETMSFTQAYEKVRRYKMNPSGV